MPRDGPEAQPAKFKGASINSPEAKEGISKVVLKAYGKGYRTACEHYSSRVEQARREERIAIGEYMKERVDKWGSDLVTTPYGWIEDLMNGQALFEE